MKTTRFICMILALLMLLALAACGNSNSAPKTETSEYAEKPTYTLKYSSISGADTIFDTEVIKPLENILYENTKNQLALEIYYSGTLANQGTCFDAIKTGTVDIGEDVTAMYAGVYLYGELLYTPGIDFVNDENFMRVSEDYYSAFHDEALDNFYVLGRIASGAFGCLTVDTPIRTAEDNKGITYRATGNYIPYLEQMGAVGTFLPMSDIYESIRLNVIDGAFTTLGGVNTFGLGEITNYFTDLPWIKGENFIVMNREIYDSLPADIQDGLNNTKDELMGIGIQFAKDNYDQAVADIKAVNPNFTFVEVTDTEGFLEAAAPLLEAKASELDSKGLDGTGALEWLQANAHKYI